jgi:hypothetical protein
VTSKKGTPKTGGKGKGKGKTGSKGKKKGKGTTCVPCLPSGPKVVDVSDFDLHAMSGRYWLDLSQRADALVRPANSCQTLR